MPQIRIDRGGNETVHQWDTFAVESMSWLLAKLRRTISSIEVLWYLENGSLLASVLPGYAVPPVDLLLYMLRRRHILPA